MKIDLNNAPRYIKCLKNFYGFKRDSIYELMVNIDEFGLPIEDEAYKTPITLDTWYELTRDEKWDAISSRLHIELINALEDGIFDIYELSEDEKIEKEIIIAANISRKNYSRGSIGDSHNFRNGFIEGAKWYRENFKN